jgi:hypothetical protein
MDIIELEYQSEHESSGRVSETVNPGNVICPEVSSLRSAALNCWILGELFGSKFFHPELLCLRDLKSKSGAHPASAIRYSLPPPRTSYGINRRASHCLFVYGEQLTPYQPSYGRL